TRYDLLLCRRKGRWVCVEAVRANHLMRAAFEARAFGAALDYREVKAEHRVGRSRFDFFLSGGARPLLVEVKAVTLEEDGVARFPDAPTERGRRHLLELAELREREFDTMVVLVALLSFARRFCPADATDPEFGETLRAVSAAGLPVWVLAAEPGSEGICLTGALPVDFDA
ncbi:MAG: DNA/RNA nuclease SfsA, partial [Myxococcales bacterium]|nr:DNA/RNA nuclease SfsA [Myxococcales bacterium]